jgi:DNA mismatch repair protein MutS2
MGIFEDIFIEIGDEQSIDQDLSTYSSHLTGIKKLLDTASSNTLFLIDEFGAGTDPQLGGALAEACLELLEDRKSTGVVTTHYSNLKLLADKYPTIINGAMLFDTEKMKPLYILKTGKPGSSFAFEIAARIGLSRDLIEKASEKTGKTQLDFEKQIQELESEKLEVRKNREQFLVADDFLSEQIEKYEKKVKELDQKRANIIEEAKKQAEEIIQNSNRLIERTIKEIKEAGAEKQKTRHIREKFENASRKISPKKPPLKTTEKEKELPQQLKIGDWATQTSEGQDITGKIIEIKGKNATLDINGISFRTRLESLKPAKDKPSKTITTSKGKGKVADHIQKKSTSFKLSIDIRGKSAEEAINEIQTFIDDAILLSIKEVTILHGKGDGILRKVTRELLSGYKEVEGFMDEHVERGGSGITIVKLK